jgi:hypothetical protein
MRDEGMIDLPGEPEDSEGEFDWEDPSDLEDEPAWLESLPELVRDDDDLGEPRERHPLQDQAQDLMVRLHKLFEGVSGPQGGQVDMILGGAGEMMGGLAQAMSGRRFESGRGLALVQLKRALRGAAFARGALFPLRCEGLIHDDVFNELQSTINGMESEILAELSRLRAEGGRDD